MSETIEFDDKEKLVAQYLLEIDYRNSVPQSAPLPNGEMPLIIPRDPKEYSSDEMREALRGALHFIWTLIFTSKESGCRSPTDENGHWVVTNRYPPPYEGGVTWELRAAMFLRYNGVLSIVSRTQESTTFALIDEHGTREGSSIVPSIDEGVLEQLRRRDVPKEYKDYHDFISTLGSQLVWNYGEGWWSLEHDIDPPPKASPS